MTDKQTISKSTRKLLNDISDTVAGVSRQIESKKIEQNDNLLMCAEALELSAEALRTIKKNIDKET